MSLRMIDLLLRDGALDLDRRSGRLQPWQVTALREAGAPGSGPSLFHDAEVLVVDQVTRYLYEISSREDWGPQQFTQCMPHFETCWIETRAPAALRSGTAVRPWQGPSAWGALFVASAVPTNLAEIALQPQARARAQALCQAQWEVVCRVMAYHEIAVPESAPGSPQDWVDALPEDCRHQLQHYAALVQALDEPGRRGQLAREAQTVRWHYQIVPFVQMHPQAPIRGPLLYGMALVGADGQLVPLPTPGGGVQHVQWSMQDGEMVAPAERRQWVEMAAGLCMSLWLSLSLLHEQQACLTRVDPCHRRTPPRPGERCRRRQYHEVQLTDDTRHRQALAAAAAGP
jgi:hypothetical protein